jgi:taurine dioxygenase
MQPTSQAWRGSESQTQMALKVTPTGGALGAEISGIDLTKAIGDDAFAQIKQAFLQHEVVYFRNQPLNDGHHLRFSRGMGEIRQILKRKDAASLKPPEIFTLSNIIENGKHIGSYDSGLFWHTDGAYAAEPHAVSILRAVEVPHKDGRPLGATCFASMTAAYDALSIAMKRRIDGLTAVHSRVLRDAKANQLGGTRAELTEEQKKNAEAVHPVVRVHPVTGRKCLYVSEGYTARIVSMPEDESRDLLAELTAHCIQPRFRYTHDWQVHDLLMWDDCSTQHRATFDYALPQRRLMYKTTLATYS